MAHDTDRQEQATNAAEERRLAALGRLGVLDTPPDESIDRITRLVRAALGTPIALVSLVDETRVWHKSRVGDIDLEVPRDLSFCTHTIASGGPMIVADARADPRFADNPLVLSGDGIRFYVGVPLTTRDGEAIGALCAVDRTPREPTEVQVALMQDLARLVIDEFELRRLARFDGLTGLLNRRAFLCEAERETVRWRRYGTPLSLIAFDIDRFKAINDLHGHAAGDAVLRAVAERCRQTLRDVDLIGRTGGEEFAAALPETGLDGAMIVAERLRESFAERAVATGGGPPLRFTASFGVAVLAPGDADLPATLARADGALYRAKQTGRDRVVAAPGPGQPPQPA